MSVADPNYNEREQSEIKHYALRLYLEAATRIIGTTRNLKFVDCCAGPWKESSSDFSDTSFGIAFHTLKNASHELSKRGRSPKFECLLIEKNVDFFTKLNLFAQTSNTPELSVQARNWDFTEKLQEIVRFCSSSGSFPFVSIDPKGWQLAGISRIKPLLKLDPGEVLINLMSSFIGRFIKDNRTDFSDLLDSDFPALRSFSGAELESAIVEKYCEIVKREGGYAYVCSLPIMNPDLDSFNFHLIYATRHIKGVQVFKDVERRTQRKTHEIRAELQQRERQIKSGNLELFGPSVQYHENCYQRLTRTNKQRARESVRTLLESKPITLYDDCWNEALQFSAVFESDLRHWINVWVGEGKLEVQNKMPRDRVLNVGKNVSLRPSAAKLS